MPKVHIVLKGQELTQDGFNKIEKYVLEYFMFLWNQVRESIYVLRGNNIQFIKSELCLAFIGADSLSRFREIIKTGKEIISNKDRFRKWFDDFVFTDKNEAYKKYWAEINCDSSTAWKLRNSLLHFYGLPSSELVGFATLDQSTTDKFKKMVSKNHSGKQIRVVNPYRLIEAILSGFLVQGEELKLMINSNDDSQKEIYIRGTVKCFEIIQTEGSVYVPLSNLIKDRP